MSKKINLKKYLSSSHRSLLSGLASSLSSLSLLMLASCGVDKPESADLVVLGTKMAESASVSYEYFEPNHCAVVEGCLVQPGHRRLLRFDSWIYNKGKGDFLIGVTPPDDQEAANYLNRIPGIYDFWTTLKNVKDREAFYKSIENWKEKRRDHIDLEWSDCETHMHYHAQETTEYSLVNALVGLDGKPVPGVSDTVYGHKQGYCMLDSERISGDKEGKFTCTNQGITSGWADAYNKNIDCQWIDITDVPAGTYKLQVTVNPTGVFKDDANRNNNSSVVEVVIPEFDEEAESKENGVKLQAKVIQDHK